MKFILGMVVLVAIKILVKEVLGESLVSDYIRYLFMGFWITVIAPWLFTKMFGASLCLLPRQTKISSGNNRG